MKKLTIRYNQTTNRVTQTYWGNDDPDWSNEVRDGTAVTTTTSTEQKRKDALTSALNSVEAGTDYEPDTETPVGKLCYDPDTDELYGEVEIRPL